MTKRKCEFDYNFEPQQKMYINQREFEKVNVTAMSKIHNKTLDYLFKGSKNVFKSPKCGLVIKKNISENNGDFCTGCNDINVIVCKCQYCEKDICQNCVTSCINCDLIFCKSCSVKLYMEDTSEGYCLSCYSVGKIEI